MASLAEGRSVGPPTCSVAACDPEALAQPRSSTARAEATAARRRSSVCSSNSLSAACRSSMSRAIEDAAFLCFRSSDWRCRLLRPRHACLGLPCSGSRGDAVASAAASPHAASVSATMSVESPSCAGAPTGGMGADQPCEPSSPSPGTTLTIRWLSSRGNCRMAGRTGPKPVYMSWHTASVAAQMWKLWVAVTRPTTGGRTRRTCVDP